MTPAPAPNKRQRLVDGPRLLAGIVVAALAAGPVFFIAGTLLSGVIASPRSGALFGWVEGQALPFLLLLSIRYVFLSAILPVTLGATMMAVLGAMFRGARSWPVWMLAGLVIAGLICLLFDLISEFRLLGAAMLITGWACGLICRAFARWPQDADAAAAD